MEIYRFRTINSLLGEHQELEKQSIYFAKKEELNDPIEGYNEIYWNGDKIAWEGLFKHYIVGLYTSWQACIIGMPIEELPVIAVNIIRNQEFLEKENKVQEILKKCMKNEQLQKMINILECKEEKISKSELKQLLSLIHKLLLNIILENKLHLNYNKEKDIKEIEEFISDYSDIKEPEKSILFGISQNIDEQYDFLQVYERQEKCSKLEYDKFLKIKFLYNDYPKKFVDKLIEFINEKGYIASFSKEYSNFSMWGNYAKEHTGVCFVFEEDLDHKIKLKQINGSYEFNFTFDDINYLEEHNRLNYFNLLGRFFKDTRDFLLKNSNGEISKYYIEMNNDRDKWREEYWNNFHRQYYIKSQDWKFEKEARLLLGDILDEFTEKEKRIFQYDFRDLKGIIFGIKTSDDDKIKILKILSEKCKKENRKDFKIYQAYFDEKERVMKRMELKLLEEVLL